MVSVPIIVGVAPSDGCRTVAPRGDPHRSRETPLSWSTRRGSGRRARAAPGRTSPEWPRGTVVPAGHAAEDDAQSGREAVQWGPFRAGEPATRQAPPGRVVDGPPRRIHGEST